MKNKATKYCSGCNQTKSLEEFHIDVKRILEEIVFEKDLQLLTLRHAEEEGWDDAEELFEL